MDWPNYLYISSVSLSNGYLDVILTNLMKSLEKRYQEGEGLDDITRFNPTACVCLSQVRTSIASIICGDLFYVQ